MASCANPAPLKISIENKYGVDAILVVSAKKGGLYTSDASARTGIGSIFDENSPYFGVSGTAYFRSDTACKNFVPGSVIHLYAGSCTDFDGSAWLVPLSVVESAAGSVTLAQAISSPPPGVSLFDIKVSAASGTVAFNANFSNGVNTAINAEYTPRGGTAATATVKTWGASGEAGNFVNQVPSGIGVEVGFATSDPSGHGTVDSTLYSSALRDIRVMLSEKVTPSTSVDVFPGATAQVGNVFTIRKFITGELDPTSGYDPDIPFHRHYSYVVINQRSLDSETFIGWIKGRGVDGMATRFDEFRCIGQDCGWGEVDQPDKDVPVSSVKIQERQFLSTRMPDSLAEAYAIGTAPMFRALVEEAPGFASGTTPPAEKWWSAPSGTLPSGVVKRVALSNGGGDMITVSFRNIEWLNPDLSSPATTTTFATSTTSVSPTPTKSKRCACGSEETCYEWNCWYSRAKSGCYDYYCDYPYYTVGGFLFSLIFFVLVFWLFYCLLRAVYGYASGPRVQTGAVVSITETVVPKREPFSA